MKFDLIIRYNTCAGVEFTIIYLLLDLIILVALIHFEVLHGKYF